MTELTHAGRAADITSNNSSRSFIDQQAGFYRCELAAHGVVQQVDNLTEGFFQLDGVRGTPKALEALASRADALREETSSDLGVKHRGKLEERIRQLEGGNAYRISGTGKQSAKFDKLVHCIFAKNMIS